MSFHCVSGVVVFGPASAIDYRTKLNLPGDPVTPKPASARGLGAALCWFSVRLSHVGSLSSLLVDNGVELYGPSIAHAPLDLVRVVPCDRYLVEDDVFAVVAATVEAVPIPNVKPFSGSKNASVSVSA